MFTTMPTKAHHHRKDNTRSSGTMWLLTDTLPIVISAMMPWTLVKLMQLVTRWTWVSFLWVIRPQAGMYLTCPLIPKQQGCAFCLTLITNLVQFPLYSTLLSTATRTQRPGPIRI